MDHPQESRDTGGRLLDDDTIAAIATPPGQAGIGIVRISGPLSAGIAEKIFQPARPAMRLQSHRLYLGRLVDPSSGCMVDEVLLSYMKAPHSYTREDVVEINSHSGHLLLSTILQMVLDHGARLARPGEFTLRAFLNGRIDLTQAEAVAGLIHSQSVRGLHLASRQVQGTFRQEIESLRQQVVDILARVEAAIDFPEEEAGILPRQETAGRVQEQVIEPVACLIRAHAGKKVWVDGVETVIAGRVNAGKSSLLNRLLNEDRAIVTPVPGTTRDVIRSPVSIHGVPFHLMDTAGFGGTKDEVERIGVRLARQAMDEADFVLLVVDSSRPIDREDLDLAEKARGKRAVVVINKIDLPSRIREGALPADLPRVRVSALTGEGLDDLRDTMSSCVLEGDAGLSTSRIAPNLRHKQALTEAARFFRDAVQCLKEDGPAEVVALELKSGLDALGEIIGETTSEEVLNRIFSRFCIGK